MYADGQLLPSWKSNGLHSSKKGNWSVWKDEAIERVRKGESVAYYGFLKGRAICEAAAMLAQANVQNSTGSVNEKTACLCKERILTFRNSDSLAPL